VAPAIFSVVFAAAIGTLRSWRMPGAPFLLASVILLGAVALGLTGARRH